MSPYPIWLTSKLTPIGLCFLNVGVEISRPLFIAARFAVAAAVRWAARRLAIGTPAWLWRVPPYAIGGIASYWVLERIATF